MKGRTLETLAFLRQLALNDSAKSLASTTAVEAGLQEARGFLDARIVQEIEAADGMRIGSGVNQGCVAWLLAQKRQAETLDREKQRASEAVTIARASLFSAHEALKASIELQRRDVVVNARRLSRRRFVRNDGGKKD